MKTITFVYCTDTEDLDEAISEARLAILDYDFDPTEVEDDDDEVWHEA